jgi:hypothetical protein
MTNQPSNRGLARSQLAELRALVPCRPLTFSDARVLAERQANHLLRSVGLEGPPFPLSVIADLPRVDVQIVPSLPASGATRWSRGMWRIRANGSEAPTRIRFTVCHELKHALDARDESIIFSRFGTRPDRELAIEMICDHFAACLLMPKRWVKRYWGNGTQDIAALAWHFEVSPQAMRYRLTELGLLDEQRRCHGLYKTTEPEQGSNRTFWRASSPAHAALAA